MNTTEKLKYNTEYSRNKQNRMQNGTEDNMKNRMGRNRIDRAEESRIEQLCLSQWNKIL